MADSKFVELIFTEPDQRSSAAYKRKIAYQSLAKNPQQLFALFIDKGLSTTFFSAFEKYGNQLATLLSNFTEYFGPLSKHGLHFGKDELSLRMPEEILGAFLFSLLVSDFPDAASQQSAVNIIIAVINLSKPGGALKLLGARLGELPSILNRLIVQGHIAKLFRNQSMSVTTLLSNDMTLGTWAGVIAKNHAGQCAQHLEKSRGVRNLVKMLKFLKSFPCDACPAIPDANDRHSPRDRKINLHGINSGIRVFDSLLGQHLGPWKVVISERALRDLREAAHSDNSDHVRESLLLLASGEWTQESLRRPIGDDRSCRVPVYKAECKRHVIIWQVDVASDERQGHNMQVVKVWAICAPEVLEDICRWVIQVQQAYTDARVAACQTINLEGAKIYPMAVISPGLSEDLCDKGPTTIFGANPETPLTAEDHTIAKESLILGNFYSLTTTVLDNTHPGASASVFPVDPSYEELHVINHFKNPTFILGTSGTKKTTCLIYKLASRYLSSKNADEIPVRQLFLTRSKDVAQNLRLYTKRLINTRLGIIAEDQSGDCDNSISKESEEETTQDLFSLDQEDFPLVCTFDYFLRLLENLVRVHDRPNTKQTGTSQLVNFTTFKLEYWQRLPTNLTRRIPIDLAFTDILGVIKGSASLASNLKPLSRDAYTTMHWRLAPNFTTESDRKVIYSLYEHYEKIKISRGEVDDTDRVIQILEALKKDPKLHRTVETFLDEVYIDEVQDQRPLEIDLLLTLIRDPWGIHFAGDTVRSISKDSLFRFANANALIHTRLNDLSPTAHKQYWLMPTLFPLPQNYSTNKGILAIASILMDLLYTAFPELVDKLPPEIGDQTGPMSTLFVGSGLVSALHGTEASTKKDTKGNSGGNPTDEDPDKPASGGLRVILVRDEQTQSALQKQVPTSTLVLTIAQSKGMEFDDVFLYNFFTTSPYRSDFKILEDLLCERYSLETGESARYANWDMIDSILCSELKHLYVGITRAQTRLWIIESDEHAVLPVINLFNEIVPTLFPKRYPNPLLNVIREYEFGNVSELRKLFNSTDQTTPTKWRELAYKLIAKKAYTQAGLCFKTAQDKAGEALASAYLAELKGMEYRARSSKKEFTVAFEEACKFFLKAGRISKAVECQLAIGNMTAAAEILSESGRHEEAAWLFTKAENHKKAVQEYAELNKHEKVLAACYYAGLYNELAAHLKDFAPKIDPNCRKQYSRLCYLLLIQEKCPPKLQAAITQSLGSSEEQEHVFREFGMMNHVFHLHETNKKFKDAYEVAVNIGFLEEAVRLANNHGLLVPQSGLENAFNYVQAEHLLVETHPSNPKKSKVATHKRITRKPNNKAILSLNQIWKSHITSLNRYKQYGETLTRDSSESGMMSGFFDLLITVEIPRVGATVSGLTSFPLEFIAGAMDMLDIVILHKTLPPPVLLFLGVYEIPTQPGKYIALPRAPGIKPKLRFPIQYVDIGAVYDIGVQFIRCLVSSTLSFIEKKTRKQGDMQVRNGVFQRKGHGKLTSNQLTSNQFSANIREFICLNVLFSNFETILSSTLIKTEPVLAHQQFWQQALIRLMTFTSSYEQDAVVLVKAQKDLGSSTHDLKRLYTQLGDNLLSQLQSRTRPQKPFGLLSYLLQQMQLAAFLCVEPLASRSIVQNMPKLQELKSVIELVILTQYLRVNTTSGNFPGHFCENILQMLSNLMKVQNSRSQQLFYSPSVLSLYEELITLLIILIRPTHFVIPQSWAIFHLHHFLHIPRSTSKREMFWYQKMLVKVVASFCELVRRTEDAVSSNPDKADNLARRSLYILVISIINAGTISPRPTGYGQMWSQVQKVFSHSSFQARAFLNLPPKQLLQNLAKAFGSYDGKDKLCVAVTNGYNLPDKFAGFPLEKLGIAATYIGIPAAHRRRPGPPNASPGIQMINAAYLITIFWRTNGPRFVQRMKCKREHERYAYERLIQRQPLKACQNSCILAEMRYSKDSIY